MRQVALDPEGAWQDPASVLTDSLALEPAAALAQLASAHAARSALQRAVGAGLAGELAQRRRARRRGDPRARSPTDELSEPAVAAELGVLLPAHATLFVASSMPVRDIETFWPVREDPPRVLCNRGANGIDGTVSSAFGAAAHGPGPVLLLIGDVALAHDIGGLLAATRLGAEADDRAARQRRRRHLRLPGGLAREHGARAATPTPRRRSGPDAGEDIYTRHVATPTGLDFANAAALYGLAHERVSTISAFRAAMERALSPAAGSTIVQVQSDRARTWRCTIASGERSRGPRRPRSGRRQRDREVAHFDREACSLLAR